MNMLLIFIFLTNSVLAMSKPQSSHNEVMKVINQYSKLIKKRDNILLRIYGLSYAGPDKIYDGKIHEIDLAYSIDKNLKYHEARERFYDLVDGFLKEINGNESIQKYFYHSPVTYEDLHFTLSFDYESKGHLNKDDVDMISIFENRITYFIAKEDGMVNKMIANEMYAGVGTLTFTGLDSIRTIIRNLPETEEQIKETE